MDLAIIQDGIVVNVIVGDAETLVTGFTGFTVVPLPDGVGIGWIYDGQAFTPPSLTAIAPT